MPIAIGVYENSEIYQDVINHCEYMHTIEAILLSMKIATTLMKISDIHKGYS